MKPYALALAGHVCLGVAWLVMPLVLPSLVAWFFAVGVLIFGWTGGILFTLANDGTSVKKIRHEVPLVLSVVGLGLLGWYLGNMVAAKTAAVSSSDPWVKQEAHSMWITELSGTILVLVMISLTMVVQLVTVVTSTIYLIRRCRGPPPSSASV